MVLVFPISSVTNSKILPSLSFIYLLVSKFLILKILPDSKIGKLESLSTFIILIVAVNSSLYKLKCCVRLSSVIENSKSLINLWFLTPVSWPQV